jgi:hypothetical protein
MSSLTACAWRSDSSQLTRPTAASGESLRWPGCGAPRRNITSYSPATGRTGGSPLTFFGKPRPYYLAIESSTSMRQLPPAVRPWRTSGNGGGEGGCVNLPSIGVRLREGRCLGRLQHRLAWTGRCPIATSRGPLTCRHGTTPRHQRDPWRVRLRPVGHPRDLA